MKKIIFSLLVIITLASCRVTKIPLEIGGSKPDGVVYYQIRYRAIDKVSVDWESANNSALLRCRAWDYKGARFFGSG